MENLPSNTVPSLGLSARATVNRVVDGDTIDMLVLGVLVRIRLLDCWAPETRGVEREEGLAAKAFLEGVATQGKEAVVWIPTDHAERLMDILTFGRVLGRVWLRDSGRELSAVMVSSGHATATKDGGATQEPTTEERP